jgi:hypothetical protein
MKVIHLPTAVGGNPQGISKHLNQLGVNSQTWVFEQNYLKYPADKIIKDKNNSIFFGEIKRILSLSYIFNADIVFYNYGSGLFKPFYVPNKKSSSFLKYKILQFYGVYSGLMARLELNFIKIFNKPIFIQYQGDDARQGDFCINNFEITFADRVGKDYYTKKSDNAKRESIKFYCKNAEKIYSLNPDLLHILPDSAEFLPYSHISLSEWLPLFNQNENRPLRIGHAPSHRAVKGTELIIDAVEELKLAGYHFDFILIEGISSSEAKEIYKNIDVLVDQLFAGWYGGLAVEAMALGKPVIAYIRQEDLHFIPAQMRMDLPIFQAEPRTIHEVLENILKMPRTDLVKMAKKSRAYVEKWHNPITIAKRIKTDMEFALGKKK